jgi:hypothetical protein
VGADQYLLPHLGAQARILLDRFVASGAAGVSGRDADDWVLSRLIQLRYVEESTVDDTIFVCTAAGRHRWQIEMMADERRGATALHRQLIRRRLDERFTRLGIDTSTALMAIDLPPEPRLHRRVPAPWNPPPQATMRLSAPLAAVFAATAFALVVISAAADPQEGWHWLFVPKPHAAAVLAARKVNTGQAALVGTRAAAVAAPVDRRTDEASRHAVASADAAPVSTQRAASVDTIAWSQKRGYEKTTYQAEQGASVRNRTPTKAEPASRARSAVVIDAASLSGGTILNSAVTAAALIDVAVSGSGHITTELTTSTKNGVRSAAAALIGAAMSDSERFATDVTAGVERNFKPTAAALLQAAADMGKTISEWGVVTQQVRDDVSTPIAPPPAESEQQAALQAAFASHTETEPVGADSVHGSPGEHVTAIRPAVRRDKRNVDPQHAAVERLNTLSLAAARHGETWRPM